MREVLAENLEELFHRTKLNGKRTYKGRDYEVWEVSDDDYKVMCEMDEDTFIKLCPDGMWRGSNGSVMGTPDTDYIINNQKIVAWDGVLRLNHYNEICEDCFDKERGICDGSRDDIDVCYGERKYTTLLNYLCDEMNVSSPRNVCAVATDLARYNGITLGELFSRYQGFKF